MTGAVYSQTPSTFNKFSSLERQAQYSVVNLRSQH
jgi:hypothetical protein